MTTRHSQRLLRLCIATVSVLSIAAVLLDALPAAPEEAPSIRAAEPIPSGMSDGSPGPTERPEALVGVSALGAPTATPGPATRPEWVRTRRATTLWSEPSPPSKVVAPLPEGHPLKVLGTGDGRIQVYYEGDGGDADESEGEGWVDQSEVEPAPAPRWVLAPQETELRTGLRRGSDTAGRLPKRAVVEVLEDRGSDLRVFYLGNGRDFDPLEGWVSASEVVAAGTMLAAERRGMRRLTRSEVASLHAGEGLWMRVPFRSQMDGSPAESSNCGPASVGMVLEQLHSFVPTDELRTEANRLQGTWGPDNGFGIEFLAQLVERYGLRVHGLYEGVNFRRWSLEDLRSQLGQGRPAIVELRFRYMPGRADSDSWDDHYVVISGMLGDDFVYNDSVDVDGPGYGRVMSADDLQRAWGGSDFPFAALAVSRP